MNCQNYSEIMMRYFDNDLNDIEHAQFRQHLKACKSCREEFEDMEQIVGYLEKSPLVAPPENFEFQVMERIQNIRPEWSVRSSLTSRFLYGFTSLLILLLLFMFTYSMIGGEMIQFLTKKMVVFQPVFAIVSSIFAFLSSIFDFFAGLMFTLSKALISLAKNYYYFIILAMVMLFAIQWMYVSLLRQIQGGHAK